jgi:glycosyltransferase involved in cell wall biosynthesis
LILKILFLVPAPHDISPGQRFRFEHYLDLRPNDKYKFTIKPFYSKKTWSIIHKTGHTFQKIFGILGGFAKRFFTLFTVFKYDYVYIYREASVIGPPVFEWIIAKLFRKKIIYDFDDAIWVSIASESNPGAAFIKCTWKVANICRMSHIVTVGNSFLGDYAKQYCKDVRLIPTVVNTDSKHNREKNQADEPVCIGWTGTYTNFYNLLKINPVITKLKKKYNFIYFIIADKDPKFPGIDYVYKKWNLQSEIADLLQIHIGLMPLENSDIELGKCAFKAIQYMSLGIPAVVSPVGANLDVVQDEINGFWADSADDWSVILEKLLVNTSLRRQIGMAARSRVENYYSVKATSRLFFDLFKQEITA